MSPVVRENNRVVVSRSNGLVVLAFLLELIAAILLGFSVATAVPALALVAGGLAAYFLAQLV